tara:strand:+ start:222 stop:914 length:693 start_codon:yes stop_codon:yes gene_type:complete
MKLSIIVPVFNEQNTILKIIKKINNVDFIEKEIIIIDDGSTDKTKEFLKTLSKEDYNIFYHEKNLGKGAAIQTAKKFITGDIVIIQDADLEYDPKDYKSLVRPILNGQAEVVYGSRVLNKNRYSLVNFSSIYRIFFNHMLTIFSNIINKQSLTDAHTCYKTFSIELFNSIDLREKGFSFCPEITTKIAKKNIDIKEVPIEYYGRSYKEGKKIKVSDGVKALLTILKYKFK